MTPFVGRAKELQTIEQLWGSASLWIWGAPGVGKSRLAHAALAQGAVAVDLSTCTTEREFVDALADALDVATGGGAPWDELHRAALALDAPLLLDNVDAVREHAARFVQALRVGVAITCRSGPPSESLISLRLGPLTPDAARELFAEAGGEAVLDREPALVAQLLERLDHLPLAIEFAAHRTRLLPVREQLDRLDAGEGTSLDGVIAWMWQELSANKQAVVLQCCAFSGAFEARAIEQTAPPLDGVSVLDVLDQLLADAWLERIEADGAIRFRLLHSLRDFAMKAAPHELSTAAWDRTLAYWVNEAPRLSADVEGRDGVPAMQRLMSESRSLQTAFERAVAVGDVRALVVLLSLRQHAYLVGPPGWTWSAIERAHRLVPASDDDVAADFLGFATEFAHRYRWPAESFAREAVERARQSGDPGRIARARAVLGGLGHGPAAVTALEEGLELDEWRASALERIGEHRVAALDADGAMAAFREALGAHRAAASDVVATRAMFGIARALLCAGRVDAALAEMELVRQEAVRRGFRAHCLEIDLAVAAAKLALGEVDAASETCERIIATSEAMGASGLLSTAWVLLAKIRFVEGKASEAIGAARSSQRAAQATRDTHSAAVAAALTACLLWADGRTALSDDLLSNAVAARDPLTGLAQVVAFVGMRATQGSSAQSELSRALRMADGLEGRAGVIARDIAAIGRAFAHLCDASSSPQNAPMVDAAREELDSVVFGASVLHHAEFYRALLLAEARSMLARLDERAVDLPADIRHDVLFHANCHWLRIDNGEPIDLNSRKQLRVIVKALARQYFADPSVLVSVEELVDVGWQGEAMTPSSGRSRIYTAIRDLRKMGLEALIVTEDGGYRLAHDVRYRVADPTGILAPDDR